MEHFTFIIHMADGSRRQETVRAGCEELAWETIRMDYPDEYIELF